MKLLRKLRLLMAMALMVIAIGASAATPKYIFYFIGDGMGMNPVMAAALYNKSVLGNDNLPLMMTFPVAGQVMTFSASSDVTDSAAAGTALATGHKTNNGMLGVTPDTISVFSVAHALKQKGFGVGLVTNVAPDDATPGAFYAHVPSRGMRKDIDMQFIDSNVDFLAGSALNGVTDRDGNSTGVLEAYKQNKIDVVNDANVAAKSKNRVVLLPKEPFNSGNCGYMVDNLPGMITLPEMTQACLDNLMMKTPKGFFMMVEGGNIDHALHANDAGSAISEIFNFNNALQVAYDFMQKHPEETLIVVTADHDTGGLTCGNAANGYTMHLDVLSHQKMSKSKFSDYCQEIAKSGNIPDWDAMKKILEEKFGFWNQVKLSDKETQFLADSYDKVFRQKDGKDEKSLYSDFNSFAGEVFRMISKKAAVGFTTGSHTGGFVPVYSAGVGSEKFGRVVNNIEIPGMILSIAGN